jgi:hypothetical protein
MGLNDTTKQSLRGRSIPEIEIDQVSEFVRYIRNVDQFPEEVLAESPNLRFIPGYGHGNGEDI